MNPRMRIQDIARLAGVSMSTVSRVLNESDYVGSATKERVLRVIEKYQYVPSANAQGLKGHSQVIGLLLPEVHWTAVLEVLWGVTAYIGEHTNYTLSVYSCPTEKHYDEICQSIKNAGLVAGILAMTYNQPVDPLVELYKEGLSVVLIDTVDAQADIPRVQADQYGGAYRAVQYLIEQGHRRIAHIRGAKEYQCSFKRYQGYCDALRDKGIEIAPELVYQGDFQLDAGYKGAQNFFGLVEKPTAIFASNDTMAYGAIHYMRAHNIRVPEDVAVIGFNDDHFQDYGDPYLTTVRQPIAEMAKCAVDALLAQIDSRYQMQEQWQAYVLSSQPIAEREIGKRDQWQAVFPTPLIVRKTTDSY